MTDRSGRTRADRSRLAAAILLSAAWLALGCASTGGSSTSIRGTTITAEDLANTSYSDVYEVLDQHRMIEFRGENMFLRDRGVESFREEVPMLVVVDGAPLGTSARTLSSMPVETIQRIEIVRSTQAAPRYGTRAGGGAVVITTK